MAYSPSRERHTSHEFVATTDATVTTIKTIPVKLNSIVYVEAVVTAVRTGGTAGATGDSAVYHITRGAKNSAGTVVLMGASDTAIVGVEDQPAWDCAFSASGGTILLRVTGAANNNVSWNGTIKVTENI